MVERPSPEGGHLRVVVVGGGVVGLSCAYELERAGAEVTVVERGDRCGGATLSRERRLGSSVHLDPHARPGASAQALKMLFKHDGSPLHPSPRSDFLRWCWRFWRSSSRERPRRASRR